MSDQLTQDTAIQSDIVEAPAVVEHKPDPKLGNDPTGLRDTIQKAVKESAAKDVEREAAKTGKNGVPIGEDGKFKAKAQDASQQAAQGAAQPKDDKKAAEAATTGADQPKKADAAPGTWKPEARAKWETTDPVVKAEVLRRESEGTRELGKLQQQIQSFNQAYGPIEQAIGSRRELWNVQFGGVDKALTTLLNLSDLASQKPNDFLAYYLSQPDIQSKVDLQKLFGPQAGGGPQTEQVAPAIMQEINGLKQQLQQFQTQAQQREVSTLESEISAFAQEKDATSGTPLRPHFDAVRAEIFHLIPAITAQFPGESPRQIMDRAYKTATVMNGDVASQIQQDQERQAKERAEAAERTRKAALANKSISGGAPRGESVAGDADPNDLRATLKRKLREQINGDARI